MRGIKLLVTRALPWSGVEEDGDSEHTDRARHVGRELPPCLDL